MTAEADVDDVDVVVDRPAERGDETRVVAGAGGAENLEGVQIDARSDADDEVAILVGGDRARDMRPVAVVVHRVAVVVDEVVAARIVREELGVDDVRHVVGIVVDVVEARVDDRELDALTRVPRKVNRPGPDVLDAPGVLVFEVAGAARMLERRQRVVELDVLDASGLLELLQLAAGKVDAQAVDQVEMPPDLALEALDGALGCPVRTMIERDDRADALLVSRPARGPGCGRRRGDQCEHETDRDPDGLSTANAVHLPL